MEKALKNNDSEKPSNIDSESDNFDEAQFKQYFLVQRQSKKKRVIEKLNDFLKSISSSSQQSTKSVDSIDDVPTSSRDVKICDEPIFISQEIIDIHLAESSSDDEIDSDDEDYKMIKSCFEQSKSRNSSISRMEKALKNNDSEKPSNIDSESDNFDEAQFKQDKNVEKMKKHRSKMPLKQDHFVKRLRMSSKDESDYKILWTSFMDQSKSRNSSTSTMEKFHDSEKPSNIDCVIDNSDEAQIKQDKYVQKKKIPTGKMPLTLDDLIKFLRTSSKQSTKSVNSIHVPTSISYVKPCDDPLYIPQEITDIVMAGSSEDEIESDDEDYKMIKSVLDQSKSSGEYELKPCTEDTPSNEDKTEIVDEFKKSEEEKE